MPEQGAVHFAGDLARDSVLLPLAERLQQAAAGSGVQLELVSGPVVHPRLAIQVTRLAKSLPHPQGYVLGITPRGVKLSFSEVEGLRFGMATLRQLLREYGRRLPCLVIRDWPDFDRRGVMLDISRGRVPSLATLLELVERLADFKINEFQLYLEHTFAYRHYEPVWREWGALTGEDILRLDARCRLLGIELVPNQNSFGHLRSWLEYAPLKRLGETQAPYEDGGGTFWRYPSTLAPNHPGTLPFLRGLYDELLPHFTSRRFNVGCDETWDLGRGRSRRLCERQGKGKVYLNFLKQIHREVSRRGFQMMFWGDIILHHAELLAELPKDLIALNWGYEAGHPFRRETSLFAESGVPFYVCPGTSTWMTLIGRHDNAFANLSEAAMAGRRHGAAGYLITDWGDGGHPQPLAVSFAPYLVGAALSWCADSYADKLLAPVLSRDVFHDPTGSVASAALGLGRAHRHFRFLAPNLTPFGAVIAAPPPERHELFCRDGLKYYAKIPGKNIRDALDAVKENRRLLMQGCPSTDSGRLLGLELDLAARMAAQSCQFMLWQQAVDTGRNVEARRLARACTKELSALEEDFCLYWPQRNKGTIAKCAPFLRWRQEDLRRRVLR